MSVHLNVYKSLMRHMHQPEIYQSRRLKLAEQIRSKTDSGIAIISTAPEVARNRDSEFPYRHDSDFFYLTGFEEPGATLVLVVENQSFHSHLFCRPKDIEREIWDGIRLGPDAAPERLGLDFAYSNQELDVRLSELLSQYDAVYLRLAQSAEHDRRLRDWMEQVRKQSRSGINPPTQLHDVDALIHEMRLFKDAHEI